ncbi:MAG: Hsp20/alpha crystallin family protein [Acidobacteriota bacterium]|nr:Hsp20/alpha crystallin family protein [Acidobacteriota bacterium]
MAAFSSSTMDFDPTDLAQDVQRLFEDLARRRPDRRHVVSGECMPVVDVFETERTVEIVLDLPGVAADALRVLIKSGVVLIVGEKERPVLSKNPPASFHLVERDFGRFARAVRVAGAVDAGGARARLSQGELRVVLPRRDERRGQGLLIPIDTGAPDGPASTSATASADKEAGRHIGTAE